MCIAGERDPRHDSIVNARDTTRWNVLRSTEALPQTIRFARRVSAIFLAFSQRVSLSILCRKRVMFCATTRLAESFDNLANLDTDDVELCVTSASDASTFVQYVYVSRLLVP